MAGGSWNGDGDIPAHPSAWCKSSQDWVTTVNRTTSGTLTIEDVKTGKTVYRLWKDGINAPGVLPGRAPRQDEVRREAARRRPARLSHRRLDRRQRQRAPPAGEADRGRRPDASQGRHEPRRRRRRVPRHREQRELHRDDDAELAGLQRPRNLRVAHRHRQVRRLDQGQGVGVVSAARRRRRRSRRRASRRTRARRRRRSRPGRPSRRRRPDPRRKPRRGRSQRRRRAGRPERRSDDDADQGELVARRRPGREVDGAEGRRRARRADRACRPRCRREGRGRQALANLLDKAEGSTLRVQVPGSAAAGLDVVDGATVMVDVRRGREAGVVFANPEKIRVGKAR